MNTEEDTKVPIRRTRSSAKTTSSPQSVTPKTTRKTKKKVVVMEVEVSDEEVPSESGATIDKQDSESIIIENKEADDKDHTNEDKEVNENENTSTEKKEVEESKGDSKESDDVIEEKQELEEKVENGSDAVEKDKEVSSQHEAEIENMEVDSKVEENIVTMDVDDSEEEPANDSADIDRKDEEQQDTAEKIKLESKETEDNNDNEEVVNETEGKISETKEATVVDENGATTDEINEASNVEEIKSVIADQEETIKVEKMETSETSENDEPKTEEKVENGNDPDTENISEDELPTVQAVKVPETEEVSDEELPGPKRAELPADTEVVSEDELPTVKKEGKRKLNEGEYDPGSPTSEAEVSTKKFKEDKDAEKEKEEKVVKPKKLPELDKFWKAVNDDPTDFTGWTYLLQYVDQENDMEAAREAYDAFLSHYPYCYGYWRKYADYEKRKGNKKKCEEVFERGLKAIPLSVDLWIHYLNYVKSSRQDDEDYVRSQFERAISACGLEFRSDRLWDSYIRWETEGKRLQRITAIYDKLLTTPTQGYTAHFESFQEHISTNPPNKVLEVDEFLALRKEVKSLLKHDTTEASVDSDAPPGDEDLNKMISTDEETKLIRERIISIRRKIYKNTVTAVSARWNFEEGIKRPYFHIKQLERCQLKNWQDYLDFEIQQGDKTRTIVLFERCLIACALYEEFWLKFIHYLNTLKDEDIVPKIRDVYERACTIHHLKKPNLHLQWAIFEESNQNANRAAEILVNLEKCVPNLLQVANRRIGLERRRGDNEKCCQLFEHYMNTSKNKATVSYHAIKYSRFQHKVMKNYEKAVDILKNAIIKDHTNPRLYLQYIDLTMQKDDVTEKEIVEIFDSFLEKESVDADQKVLFAQRKLEYLEDFGSDIQSIQKAFEDYQKHLKQCKDVSLKRKDSKGETSSSKKEKSSAQPAAQAGPYGPYGSYNASGQGSYQYSGSQPQGQYNYQQYGQNDQYPYQNWQYPQGGYGSYNQWGSYGSGYGY
ncbi:pre-mRNA-processing factor 39 isoform X2 [Coccinella septempunctata]|uniref:pre-mRNA-processing factor 39 isoform X2 n=1 Tax=Coccinella septempunctata TaxID=41139 RepID=UPI001D061DF5|nr:pre-mRNA-processing factor 39 isoform X2 [Coccinella septempunctata]